MKRDNLSAKYALSAVGSNDRPVVKFSETLGKGTLPGPFKLLRTPEALAEKKTILFANEEGEDGMVTFFDGTNINRPFGDCLFDDTYFLTVKNRIRKQMSEMPLSLRTADNHNYPASNMIMDVRARLMHEYAPSKENQLKVLCSNIKIKK